MKRVNSEQSPMKISAVSSAVPSSMLVGSWDVVARRQPSRAVGLRSGWPVVSANSATVSSSRGAHDRCGGAGAFASLRRVALMKRAQFFSSAPLAPAGSLCEASPVL